MFVQYLYSVCTVSVQWLYSICTVFEQYLYSVCTVSVYRLWLYLLLACNVTSQTEGALSRRKVLCLKLCFKALWLSQACTSMSGCCAHAYSQLIVTRCTASQALCNSANIHLLGVQCATLSLKPYQTQAKHSLTVPVAAGCIMMEFADFWENVSASSAEVLQCPRCTQVVAHPQGYCRYCKENAYQCRHCR